MGWDGSEINGWKSIKWESTKIRLVIEETKIQGRVRNWHEIEIIEKNNLTSIRLIIRILDVRNSQVKRI